MSLTLEPPTLTMEPQTTRSTVTGPVKHAHYMGLSGAALRTAIGVVAGLCFLAFGYGQGKSTLSLAYGTPTNTACRRHWRFDVGFDLP